MKAITFKFFHDGKEITKTQAQDMFDTTTFTIKDGGVYFTMTVTPVSQFFGQSPLAKRSTEKEGVKNIFSKNVQDALQRAEEHQAQFGREDSEEAERFSSAVENKIRQEKVKTVLDDVIFNNNRAERDTMEFLKETGVKETEGKLDYSEINFELFDLMAKRFMSNKHKYSAGNTKKPLDIKQIEQATFRHLRKMIQPIEGDEETYLDHLVATATNLSIILDQLTLNKS